MTQGTHTSGRPERNVIAKKAQDIQPSSGPGDELSTGDWLQL